MYNILFTTIITHHSFNILKMLPTQYLSSVYDCFLQILLRYQIALQLFQNTFLEELEGHLYSYGRSRFLSSGKKKKMDTGVITLINNNHTIESNILYRSISLKPKLKYRRDDMTICFSQNIEVLYYSKRNLFQWKFTLALALHLLITNVFFKLVYRKLLESSKNIGSWPCKFHRNFNAHQYLKITKTIKIERRGVNMFNELNRNSCFHA